MGVWVIHVIFRHGTDLLLSNLRSLTQPPANIVQVASGRAVRSSIRPGVAPVGVAASEDAKESIVRWQSTTAPGADGRRSFRLVSASRAMPF